MYTSHENFDKYHKQQKKLIRSLPSSAWTNRVSDNIENLGLYIEGSDHLGVKTHLRSVSSTARYFALRVVLIGQKLRL